MSLDKLNQMPAPELETELRKCCGSQAWARAMAEARPFESEGELHAVSNRVWRSLTPEAWKEAFASHPRIGDVENLRKKYASTASWEAQEQAGVQGAGEAVLQKLAKGNELYERKFGFIFLVCATGKSAAEMLEILERRMKHSAHEELKQAVAEQEKITAIRLRKWLHPESE